MAVLGVGGRLRLKREAPEPTVLRPGNVHVGSNSIYMRNPAFWSGDQVTLTSARGLPIDTGSNGPDCPDGCAAYFGSDWYLGANRSHITANDDAFYSTTNTIQFYMRSNECNQTTSASYYIYRDQLDRISFYTERADALNGAYAGRVTLYRVDFNSLIVSPTGTLDYENAIAECGVDIGEYRFADAQDEVSLQSICDFAPNYESPISWVTEYDNADLTPRYYINAGSDGTIWMLQAGLREWSLNLSSPEVDTTSIGEKFGDSIKSIVTGGGSLDFLVKRNDESSTTQDSTALMRLLLMTEKGCKASAEFWMINENWLDTSDLPLPGSLYYETDLIITSVAVNTRVDEVIAGSANFVTVGEIALRMGTN